MRFLIRTIHPGPGHPVALAPLAARLAFGLGRAAAVVVASLP